MLATDAPTWFDVTQSTPAITPEVEPEPEQSRTRTACSVTCLATPYVVPPVVPATWVPWPLQSLVPFPSPTNDDVRPGDRLVGGTYLACGCGHDCSQAHEQCQEKGSSHHLPPAERDWTTAGR